MAVMEIVLLSGSMLPVPPFAGYGGIQRDVYCLLGFLPRHGINVHFIGPADCQVGGMDGVEPTLTSHRSQFADGIMEDGEASKERTILHRSEVLDLAGRLCRERPVELINVRLLDIGFLASLGSLGVPVVASIHVFRSSKKIVKHLNRLGRGFSFNAVSADHARKYGGLRRMEVIHNGLDIDAHDFSLFPLSSASEDTGLDILERLREQGADYYMTLGRIGAFKGQRTAIELVLEETDKHVIIAGTPIETGRYGKDSLRYFEEELKPYFGHERVHYFGNADERQKVALLRNALGFIFASGLEDSSWHEPFGLAPVEAIAYGTPVLAYRKGAMSEILLHGENGLLFDDMDEAR